MKNQKQVVTLFSALVIIISFQRNERNRRFKHYIYSDIVLSMLSSLNPIGSQGKGQWEIAGLQFGLLTLILVSANEIVYNWILKRSYLLAS